MCVCVTCEVDPLLFSYSSPAIGYIFICISQRYKLSAIILTNNMLPNLHHTPGVLALKIVGSWLKKKHRNCELVMLDLTNCFVKQCKTKECCLPLPCMHGKSRLGRPLGQEYTTHPALCQDSGWHAGHGTCLSYVPRQRGSSCKGGCPSYAPARAFHSLHAGHSD